MRAENLQAELPGMALTASRLFIAEWMADRVAAERSIHSQMLLFVATDILDGVVLRQFDADTPLRRVTDGVVDHLSVGRVLYEIAQHNKSARPYLRILAARALVVGGLNAVHLVTTGEVTKGHGKQKTTNIATAVFGIASATNNTFATHVTGAMVAAVAIFTAPAHLISLGSKTGSPYREL